MDQNWNENKPNLCTKLHQNTYLNGLRVKITRICAEVRQNFQKKIPENVEKRTLVIEQTKKKSDHKMTQKMYQIL